MIEFLIKRPIAVIMTFLAFVLFGVVSLGIMPVSLMPNIEAKVIKVKVSGNDLTALQLEEQVVKVLRKKFQQISNIDNIESKTNNGNSIIDLTFDFKAKIDYSLIEVNEKIDESMNSFPSGLIRPRVVKLNSTDIPLFYINIIYPNYISKTEFSSFIEHIIKKRIEQIKSVAFVDINGNSLPQITITPNTNRLRNYGINIGQIKDVIESNNVNIGNLKVKKGHYEYDINFNSNISNVNDIKNLYLTTKDKNTIRLKDVADVIYNSKEESGYFYINGQRGISLAVMSKPASKIKNTKNEAISILNEAQNQSLKFKYHITQDQTEFLDYSINSLKNSLFIGGILAFIIMFFFVRDFKTSMIIGIVIPVSLIISFFFLNQLNITINIISLSGLIIGIGLMIDNSIIVIDNIVQYRRQGYSVIESCAKGTYEIIRPLLSSLLTTCSVFLPLIYLSGIAGSLFFDQAMSIIIGLSTSYLVSIILLPTLFKLFKINVKAKEHTIIQGLYNKVYLLVFKNKKAALISFLILILPLFVGLKMIKQEKFPKIEYDDFYLNIEWEENIELNTNLERAKKISTYLSNISTHTFTVGNEGFLISDEQKGNNNLEFYIKGNKNNLSVFTSRIKNFISKKYPYARINVKKSKNLFEQIFASEEHNLYLKIPFDKKEKVNLLKNKIKEKFPGVKFKKSTLLDDITIQVIPEKLILYDIQYNQVFDKLTYLFGNREVSHLKKSNTYIPIVIKNNSKKTIGVINNSFIKNKRENSIPLNSLIEIKKSSSDKYLYADSDLMYTPLYLELSNNTSAIDLINFINNQNDNDLVLSGAYFKNLEFLKELVFVAFLVLILLYFILAAQFESLLQPLIVLIEIPISLGGAFLFMMLFNVSLNIMSMIGLIIMFGIVINDSILKIDTINQLIKKNKSIEEAIHEAGLKRLNAILMTSLTTILTMTPILFMNGISSDLQKPLAIVVIGGMILGTIVSLYFVPLVYWFVKRKKMYHEI